MGVAKLKEQLPLTSQELVSKAISDNFIVHLFTVKCTQDTKRKKKRQEMGYLRNNVIIIMPYFSMNHNFQLFLKLQPRNEGFGYRKGPQT